MTSVFLFIGFDDRETVNQYIAYEYKINYGLTISRIGERLSKKIDYMVSPDMFYWMVILQFC